MHGESTKRKPLPELIEPPPTLRRSGMLDLGGFGPRADKHAREIWRVGVGSDIGGGTMFSFLGAGDGERGKLTTVLSE